MLVQVSGDELLRSDGERLVAKAKKDGVDATLEVIDGMPHDFQCVGDAPEAQQATQRLGAFIAKHWA